MKKAKIKGLACLQSFKPKLLSFLDFHVRC